MTIPDTDTLAALCRAALSTGEWHALADALMEAGDPRGLRLGELGDWTARYRVQILAERHACPQCGMPRRAEFLYSALCDATGCGWSGPAALLLPPLLAEGR